MKNIDFLDEKNINYYSGLFLRVDDLIEDALIDNKAYQDLLLKEEELLQKYRFIDKICNFLIIEDRMYSIVEMDLLSEYLRLKELTLRYEQIEIYKQGFKDCFSLLKLME